MTSNTFTVALRVMLQVVRDRRTIALIFIAPLLIATVAGFSISDKTTLSTAAPGILATLILFFGFLITGISFLRERTQGTLERMLVTPLYRMDIVAGYLLGLLVFALIQTVIMFFYMVYVIGIDYRGDLWQILVFQVLIGINAVSLGTFFSAFARNEFQMVQFIPIVIIPQVFASGLFIPVSQLPAAPWAKPGRYRERHRHIGGFCSGVFITGVSHAKAKVIEKLLPILDPLSINGTSDVHRISCLGGGFIEAEIILRVYLTAYRK
jgi:ABC-2 type transport system permease protein